MLILAFIETICQLDMAKSVHWYSYVLRMEDGYVLKKAFELEIEGQRKKRT